MMRSRIGHTDSFFCFFAFFVLQGKDRLFGFFVGKTLGASGGRADPVLINEVLKDLLKAAEAPQS